jgi:hypothetical protein
VIYIYHMAELAIPFITLVGLYVISRHNKEEEHFTNISDTTQEMNNDNNSIPINYPINKPALSDIAENYIDSNQTTDKYYDKTIFEKVEQNNPKDSVGGSIQTSTSLTGNPINKKDFKHNNMVPFFGARLKGAGPSANIAESQLDNMQGSGSQHRVKIEQAPLFKPQENLSWTNGMPSTSEFMLSRQVPGSKMNNVKPWDEQRVAPGLGQGYTTTGSGSGYNAAVEDRSAWMPKTVDELRVDTNPKESYELQGHQGPAAYYNKEPGNINTIGRIEKNRPDTDYELGPERWFTTTGIEKGQTVRSDQIIQHTNRPDYSQTDYFGAGGKDGQATYINSHINNTTKQQLSGPSIAPPTGKAAATNNDYGNGSYISLSNNRSSTRQPEKFGPAQGLVKALTAPLMDMLRPSRKENVIGSLRPSGNVQLSQGGTQPIYNPGDRTRTTVREQTEKGNHNQNIQNQKDGAYVVAQQQSVSQERDSTNIQYIGNAARSDQAMSQYSAYNQRNNPNKTFANRPSQGNIATFNSNLNVKLKTDEDIVNTRALASSTSVIAIPSIDTFGNINMPQYRNDSQGTDRISPDILTAFKNNPYTHSLNSWA